MLFICFFWVFMVIRNVVFGVGLGFMIICVIVLVYGGMMDVMS